MRRACWRDLRARIVVARGLSDVDGIVDAIDHVEIVSREGGTEERLFVAEARIDAAENGRRAFEPFAERRAVDLNHPQTVGVGVDVRHVLDGERPRARCPYKNRVRLRPPHLNGAAAERIGSEARSARAAASGAA